MMVMTIKKFTDRAIESNSGRVDRVYLVNKMAANKIPAKMLKSLGLNMINVSKRFH